eukprot:scaffold9057_cov33-Attheya_sp.AAC.1
MASASGSVSKTTSLLASKAALAWETAPGTTPGSSICNKIPSRNGLYNSEVDNMNLLPDLFDRDFVLECTIVAHFFFAELPGVTDIVLNCWSCGMEAQDVSAMNASGRDDRYGLGGSTNDLGPE